jgi:hypothetical protein
MTRRFLTGFLLVAAGFLSRSAGSSVDHASAFPTAHAFAGPIGTANPSQGAVADAVTERHGLRNSVTGDAVAVNVNRSSDTGATGVPGAPPGAVPATGGACPPDMVTVEGEYCTEVRHNCTKWLDDATLPYARCGEYEPKATCVGERIKMSFCIDRFEYTKPGEDKPMNQASFVIAQDTCKSLGKRVCTEDEWNFACEGEEMRPYPYGWKREAKCNQDRPKEDLYDPENKQYQVLADRRMAAGANKDCVSPFGVYDMVGNLDEPVLRESQRYAYPYRNGLKGGWWMPARNRCRPATTKHDDHYHDIQVGVRCCSDAPGSSSGAHG